VFIEYRSILEYYRDLKVGNLCIHFLISHILYKDPLFDFKRIYSSFHSSQITLLKYYLEYKYFKVNTMLIADFRIEDKRF